MSTDGPGKPTGISPNRVAPRLVRAHERWVEVLLASGWRPGPQFDEVRKTHPFLVPFNYLPQVEQERCHQLGLADLEEGRPNQPVVSTRRSEVQSVPALAELTPPPGDLHQAGLLEILDYWRTLKVRPEALPVSWFRVLGEHTLGLGEPLLAYDMLTMGLKHYPADVRLRQLVALSLLRAGSLVPALRILQELYDEGERGEETLGLLARAHKDLAQTSADSRDRNHHWLKAREIYGAAYQESRGYWSGINAATLARLLGENEAANKLARQVRSQCHQQLGGLEPGDPERYWIYATLGEAALILGHLEEAFRWYGKAGQIAGKRYGDLASTRRNAWLLMEVLGHSEAEREDLKKCLRIPRVAVFTGHMMDQPGRSQARFPAELEGAVAREIQQTLEKLDLAIGYSSAACGSDILFLEAMLAREGEIHIVLPFPTEEFLKASVDLIPGADWSQRFSRVVKAATRVVVACEHRVTGSPVAYEYANLLQDGLALLRARVLDTELVPLAVWDGRPGDGPGGTGSLVQYWRQQGRRVHLIDLNRLCRKPLTLEWGPKQLRKAGPSVSRRTAEPLPQKIVAVLFADVVGFSRLREEEVPLFLKEFMGSINQYLKEFYGKPLWLNTWGDALHCVFASVREAGCFALGLKDWVSRTDWQAKGLPLELSVRISLHAGPVFVWDRPVFPGQRYSGSHISRAARIEPITPPNQVYASQEFAALASSQGVPDFICEYVGQITLPKQAGIAPLYLVRRPFPEASGKNDP